MAMPKLFGEMNSNRENEGNLDHMISHEATVKCRHAREGGNLEIATGRRGHRMAHAPACARARGASRGGLLQESFATSQRTVEVGVEVTCYVYTPSLPCTLESVELLLGAEFSHQACFEAQSLEHTQLT